MHKRPVMPTGTGSMVKRNPVREMEGAEIASSKSAPCTVTVLGFDQNDILFRSDKANVIQVRNRAGEIAILLVRMHGEVWGYSRRGDEDWNEVLAIYGNKDKR